MSLLTHAYELLSQEVKPDSPGLKALEVAIKELEPVVGTPEIDKFFGVLWEKFPKEQYDGKSAPHRSKTICRKRFVQCCRRYNKTPEEIVKAIALYTSNCINGQTWFCGLDTLLMNKAGYWLDYLEGNDE